MLSERFNKYYTINTQLGYFSDKDIDTILKDAKGMIPGVGLTGIVEVNNTKIFVKRIPITDLEFSNKFDTANLFDLPLVYNYGVGSVGINCFRELDMHIKTTNWVLSGQIINFPLLYHYRIRTIPKHVFQTTLSNIDEFVEAWNNNKNIKRYLTNRGEATHELVLFLEYFPLVVRDWLKPDVKQIKYYLREVSDVVTFLKRHGVIHFDAHSGNMLSDGKTVFLTDFGLVLDKKFNVTKAELDFWNHNSYYDYGMITLQVDDSLLDLIPVNQEYFAKKYGIDKSMEEIEVRAIVYKHMYEICKDLHLETRLAALLLKFKSVNDEMFNFLDNMRQSKKKDIEFPNRQIKNLLKSCR